MIRSGAFLLGGILWAGAALAATPPLGSAPDGSQAGAASAVPEGRSVAPASAPATDIVGDSRRLDAEDARLDSQERRLEELAGRLDSWGSGVEALQKSDAERVRRMDDLSGKLKELASRQRDQAAALSRCAASIQECDSGLAADASARQRLAVALDGLSQRLDAAETKLRALDEGQAREGVSAAAAATREADLAKEVGALRKQLDDGKQRLDAGLKELDTVREGLGRVDGLEEITGMLKKDLETDEEEIVEAKQALKRLEPPPADGPGNAAWWDGIATWKYLPALAAGLSVIAVIFAVR